MRLIKVWTHASEVLTGKGIRAKDGRHPLEDDLDRIEDGAIVIEEGGANPKILFVGKTSSIPKKYLKTKALNLKGEHCVVPGFIDCHTHLVFAGDRSVEFSDRCGGATYEEIAKRGGGIATTVKATRDATEKELFDLAVSRVKEAEHFGVRTLEIKSGYGLDEQSELKILRVIEKLRAKFQGEITIIPTFLGAHAIPKGQTRASWISEIKKSVLPKVIKQKLASACDIFVDDGYFTRDDAKELLTQAKRQGLYIKIHADELGNTESASLAADLGALSADHLLKISKAGIKAISKSNTVAVLLPGTAFYLKAAHAPARALIQAGAKVAISTDFNPGTSMTLHLPAVMTIAALYLGMTRSELFAAVTYNAASALGLQRSKGTLEVGMDAQVVKLPFRKFEDCYYRFAWR